MDYTITIDNFEGPLDLLLHLIKESDIDIFNISIENITKQYFDYIKKMEELNLNIASEYLVMAAELMEIKSKTLLPNSKAENDDEFEEDPKEQLIRRLLEYQRYKEVTEAFKELEEERSQFYTKAPANMKQYCEEEQVSLGDVSLDDLMLAFQKFLQRKEMEKPLNTKITKKEYSVSRRCSEIRQILKEKKQVGFKELFDIYSKDYIVVTFLSILDLARKQELNIKQDHNFEDIYLVSKDVQHE